MIRGMPTRRTMLRAGIASLSWLAVALALALAATPARANGRFPAANSIVFSPADPRTLVGRTTFGILPSSDDGASWRWMCEDALALPSTMVSDPELALSASGALIVGVPKPYTLGVSVSGDLGCNWGCVGPLADRQVADVVLRPLSPHAVLALASGAAAPDGGLSPPQVFETTDDGATWAPLGAPLDASDPTLEVLSIDVAKSDAARIYVSATRGAGTQRRASLFVSADDGASWTERALPAYDGQSEGGVYIGAVDPTDPGRVYVRSSGAGALDVSANASCDPGLGRSRLFVTPDAGATWTVAPLPVSCQILGFALSDDGSRVYAGTFGEGLFAASRADLKFVKTSPIHVECLATRGRELWACSDAVSGMIFGVSTTEGACFEPRLLQLTTVAGPIACAPSPAGPFACQATTNGAVCTRDAFQNLCVTPYAMDPGCFVDVAPPDAGCEPGDASPGDASPGDASPRRAGFSARGGSCGCSTPGGPGPAGAAALAIALAAAAAMRRRRRA